MFILDSVAQYSPKDDREAQRCDRVLSLLSFVTLSVRRVTFCHCSVGERVMPRLSHANAAVVLSAVKVLMKMTEHIPPDSPFLETLNKKLAPPLGKGCVRGEG